MQAGGLRGGLDRRRDPQPFSTGAMGGHALIPGGLQRLVLARGLVQALTGPIATALAVLAVISCGFFAWAGRLTWGIAGSVIFGIVLVFGSAQIVNFFQSAVGGGG